MDTHHKPSDMDPGRRKRRGAAQLLWPAAFFAIFLIVWQVGRENFGDINAEAYEQSKKVLFYLLQVGLWLSGAQLISRVINYVVFDRIVAGATGAAVPRLLRDVVTVVIFFAAVAGILSVVFKQSVTGLWATSSAVGIVVGFALRQMIQDVFTGIAINLDRAFKIGDWVEVHQMALRKQVFGRVVEINWRTTLVETESRTMMIVPNSIMGTSPITNYSAPDGLNRFELDFCLDQSVPTERVLRVLLAGVTASIGEGGPVAEPAPQALLNEADKRGFKYEIRYWVRIPETSRAEARHSVNKHVLGHLRAAGLTLSYPKTDVYHDHLPRRNLNHEHPDDRVEVLSKVELFAKALTREEITWLASVMPLRDFGDSFELMSQGDAGDSMFVITEGLLYVYINTPDGKTIKVAQIGPGQAVGEMSLLTGEKRSATVRCATAVVAFEISATHLSMLLKKRPKLAEKLSEIVAIRKAASQKSLADSNNGGADDVAKSLQSEILDKMRGFFQGVLGTK